MSDNFTELKRLFDADVAVMAQAHAQKRVNEGKFIKDDKKPEFYEELKTTEKPVAAANTLARLLDGYSIATAKWILKESQNIIETEIKVSSDVISPFS